MIATGLLVPFATGDRAPSAAVEAGPGTANAPGAVGAGDDPGAALGDDSALGAVGTTAAPGAEGAATARGPARVGPDGSVSVGESGPLEATDRGVTPTTIRLGFALLDLGGASALGLGVAGYSIEQQKAAYQVFVDDINARGGINGRQIEAFYRSSDPLDRDSSQALCLGFSRDDEVFAVLAQPGFRAHLCVAQQEKMVLLIDFAASDIIASAGGRIVTNQQSGNRMMFDWIGELDRMGSLRGKKLGIVGDEDTANGDKQAVEQGVLPALEQLGYPVTYRSRLSANLNTGASQIPVEVSQMRSAGVDAVLLATNFVYATQWVQTAHSQGWQPGYFASDHNGLSGDDLMENMPASYEGAVAVTVTRAPTREARERLPEVAADRECREFFNAAAEDDYAYGETNPVIYSCGQVRLFAAAATAAGPQLTQRTFLDAVQRQRNHLLPGLFGGTFSPGKLDYADVIRPLRWRGDCKCYVYAGPPVEGRF